MHTCKIGNTALTLVKGDITRREVDVIVNAANRQLAGGGGVDGAIHRAAGPQLLAECRRHITANGPIDTGEAVLTGAGNLPAKAVIHTAGPIYSGAEEEAEQLAACYRNSLLLAARHGHRTAAFPAISTGIYGYPKKKAARIALQTVSETVRQHPADFSQIFFVLFSRSDLQIYTKTMKELTTA